MKKYVLPGGLMLLAGVYLLLSRLPGVSLPMGSFLMLMGAGFLVVRAVTRKYGWSFVAFPLLFLGLGWCVVDALRLATGYISVSTLLGLSLAFFLIHICEFRKLGNWPMIPAVILMLGGLVALALLTPDIRRFFAEITGYVLPGALILLGAALLVVGLISFGKGKKQQGSVPLQGQPYARKEEAREESGEGEKGAEEPEAESPDKAAEPVQDTVPQPHLQPETEKEPEMENEEI